MQCTDAEIAAWFSVTTRTIERRRKEPEFAEAMSRGKMKGRISLRRQQLKLLEAGNGTMAVWLGKQYLGQTDEIRHEVQFPLIGIWMPRTPDEQAQIEEPEVHTIDIAATGGN